MTDTITDEAVELAAEKMADEIDAEDYWCEMGEKRKEHYRIYARLALTAALPAIREAVGREYAGLANELDNIAQEVEHAGIAGRIGDIAARLAASPNRRTAMTRSAAMTVVRGWSPMDTAPKDGTRIAIRFASGNEHEASWHTTYGGEWHVDSFTHLPWADQNEIVEWKQIPTTTQEARHDER